MPTPTAPALLAELARYRDADPREAQSPPLALYRDPDLFEAELEAVFRRDWVCVGRADQVASPGSWFAPEVAGEPLIVARTDDGRLTAFSSVCRHRAMTIARGSGCGRRLTCPYHRWTYDLEGVLRGAPLMDLPRDGTGDPLRLPEVSVTECLGFLFVCLAPDPPPLEPQLVGAAATLAPYHMADWRNLVPVDEVWHGNWKLALETALEGYHLDGLHAGAIADMLPSAGCSFVEGHDRWSCFRLRVDFESELGAATTPFAAAMGGPDATASPTVSIHPHVNISCAPASTTWLTFLPLAVDRTRVVGGYLVPPDEYARIVADPTEHELTVAAIEQLNREDASATIDLQRVSGTRFVPRGRLNEREQGLVHFYRYLADRLGA